MTMRLSAPDERDDAKRSPRVLLNVRQAALRLGLSKSTLNRMRSAGGGPRFIRLTARAVRYDPADLDAWIEARRESASND